MRLRNFSCSFSAAISDLVLFFFLRFLVLVVE